MRRVGKGLKGGREGREREKRGGRRPRRPKQRMDEANRNWWRSQSSLLLTAHSVMPLSRLCPPTHTRTTSSKHSCPCYPHVPSRLPAPTPSGQQCPSVLLYFSFTAVSLSFIHDTNPYVSHIFPLPLESLFYPHIILTPHT